MGGDFRFRGLNGHQNRGPRLPFLTRNGSRSVMFVLAKSLRAKLILPAVRPRKSRREYARYWLDYCRASTLSVERQNPAARARIR